MKSRTVMLFGALALIPAVAAAQASSDAEQCRNLSGKPDLAIQYCTRAIESGKLPPRELAQMYLSRGVELMVKGEFDHAIADFDAVLRANPGNADALQSRGTEWMVKGDYKRAIADFDSALRANPKAQDIHFPRGRALFYSGDFAHAIAEFNKAHQVHPSDYTGLWLFLARKRGGVPDAEALIERDTRATRDGAWPSGVIALYAGQAEPDPVAQSAENSDPKKQAEQRCEAHFYIAHWHLLRKENERALRLLEEAQRSCPKNVIEYEGALAALRQMKVR